MERENLFIQVHNQKLLAESFHINVIQNIIKLWSFWIALVYWSHFKGTDPILLFLYVSLKRM